MQQISIKPYICLHLLVHQSSQDFFPTFKINIHTNLMAYNHQQVPFWDFVRSFEQNGAGVDRPAQNPAEGFNPFAASPAAGEHPAPPHPFGAGFPFGGPGFWGQGPEHHGRGGWGGRGGRRGRHGAHADNDEEKALTPNGSRSPSPNGEHTEGDSGETREGPSQGRGRHGHHGPHGPHGHGYGHHGPRGFGHGGRGGWGSWGGRGGWGEGFGGRGGFGRHGGWGEGWGGRHGCRSGPSSGGPGGFDLSALFESLAAHPLAQTFRDFAAQAAQRSGEDMVPNDTDDENSIIPPIDIFSTDDAFVLHVALPGAKKEDVGVNWDVGKGVLNLAGVVYRQGDEEFLKTLSKSERKVGVFDRSVKLPPGTEEEEEIDGDAITAKLEDGVLVVTVPKVEKDEKWTEVKKVDIV